MAVYRSRTIGTKLLESCSWKWLENLPTDKYISLLLSNVMANERNMPGNLHLCNTPCMEPSVKKPFGLMTSSSVHSVSHNSLGRSPHIWRHLTSDVMWIAASVTEVPRTRLGSDSAPFASLSFAKTERQRAGVPFERPGRWGQRRWRWRRRRRRRWRRRWRWRWWRQRQRR